MSSALQSLREHSIIVVDSGDFESFKDYQPIDVTMNPSLLLAAAQMPQYKWLLEDALAYVKAKPSLSAAERETLVCDRLAINFGKQLTQLVQGYVSTEVDPRHSFDTEVTVANAERLIRMYEEVGVPKSRILIKIATTWEGCQAAKILEAKGIRCNMTLIFSLCQAIAAAEANAHLISPFVGRILDWYKAKYPEREFSKDKDPGVISVKEIFTYYKRFGYKTTVMAASFRNTDEIRCLAGVEKLTISPKLLAELEASKEPVTKQLCAEAAQKATDLKKLCMDEKTFRWMLNEDQMATEKLSDGIRVFNADLEKLKRFISQFMCA